MNNNEIKPDYEFTAYCAVICPAVRGIISCWQTDSNRIIASIFLWVVIILFVSKLLTTICDKTSKFKYFLAITVSIESWWYIMSILCEISYVKDYIIYFFFGIGLACVGITAAILVDYYNFDKKVEGLFGAKQKRTTFTGKNTSDHVVNEAEFKRMKEENEKLRQFKAGVEEDRRRAKMRGEKYDWFVGCNGSENIKRRYKKLMQAFHPDESFGNAKIAAEINEAYDKACQNAF